MPVMFVIHITNVCKPVLQNPMECQEESVKMTTLAGKDRLNQAIFPGLVKANVFYSRFDEK